MADIQYYGTGRRKNAIARVYVRPGKGEITINRREFANYFPNEALQMIIRQPLSLTETTGKFDILVNVLFAVEPPATANEDPGKNETVR